MDQHCITAIHRRCRMTTKRGGEEDGQCSMCVEGVPVVAVVPACLRRASQCLFEVPRDHQEGVRVVSAGASVFLLRFTHQARAPSHLFPIMRFLCAICNNLPAIAPPFLPPVQSRIPAKFSSPVLSTQLLPPAVVVAVVALYRSSLLLRYSRPGDECC